MLSLTLSCLMIGRANLSKPVYFENTDELVGVVVRWPRGAALVFENQIQLIDCDSVNSVTAWSDTHLKLTTVFGEKIEIDVRKVKRTKDSIWTSRAKLFPEASIKCLQGKFVERERQGSDYVLEPARLYGLGISHRGTDFYSIETKASSTIARSQDGRVKVSMPKESIPVFIKDANRFLAISDHNSRFGHLKVFNGRNSQTIFSDAQSFIALRTKDK